MGGIIGDGVLVYVWRAVSNGTCGWVGYFFFVWFGMSDRVCVLFGWVGMERGICGDEVRKVMAWRVRR